jgi:uncharacterized protein YcsI (UPF0317 family)
MYQATTVVMETEPEDFKFGSVGNRQCVLAETILIEGDSVIDVLAKVCKRYSIDCPLPAHWSGQSTEGWFDTNFLVDNENSEVISDSYQYREWQNGDMDLWTMTLSVKIQKIEIQNMTEDDLPGFLTY